MSRWSQFVGWLNEQASKNCLTANTSPQGPIEVYAPNGNTEATPCFVGGLMHCPHGKVHCCWCLLRQRSRN